ncbi:hypothetical protein PROFUN_12314 [Planoprotostelium fungivorum]|uniref:Dol-P-Glc:Glc(2)Man(9)GlcNAc(2)-PP-Dol alpha-1,2-glucosyltransferase n=1 Tax=Planoprotostelium fungivorum TaxID=1890364 RepID=A0A2P6N7V3_9EUKA|nr:hypothetical protein PROFUN_12314 [Planoprotostelium fungivorum]
MRSSGDKSVHGYTIYLCVIALIGLSLWLAQKVNHVAPNPYMDEPFHVPQTQRYCSNNLEWDPKITTFPGLYVVAVAYAKLLQLSPVAIMDGDTCSSIPLLRSLNIFFAAGNLILLYKILSKLYPEENRSLLSLKALTLIAFPIHFFYIFLFYTDCGSTFFLLLAYLSLLNGRTNSAAVWGAVAISFRQTNIIWDAFFVAGQLLHRFSLETGETTSQPVTVKLFSFLTWALRKSHLIVMKYWAHVLLAAFFVLFVIYNDGIVVGDRSAHAPVIHTSQLLYFIGFSTFFLSFDLRTVTPHTLKSPRGFITIVSCTLLCLYTIHRYSPAHPYLLADNRHYTFYLWKNVYARNFWTKYALLPAYALSFYLLWNALRKRQSALWCLFFFFFTAATLVPALLLEFRYFLVPFFFIALHMRDSIRGNILGTMCQLAFYMMINGITFYLFFTKPFVWPNGETQRFMW